MTVTLPETLQYGKVVGRFVLAVADVPEDPDSLPNAVPAVGTISFTSMNPLTKETTATPPTTVVRSVIPAAIDNNGYLYNPKDPEGPRGIWLVAGPYKVAYSLNTGAIAGHDILVLPEHDDETPLDLISALPPGGPILTASQYAELTARMDALEAGGGGTTDHSALSNRETADQHPMGSITGLLAALSDKSPTSHDHAGVYATSAQGAKADTAVQPAALSAAVSALEDADALLAADIATRQTAAQVDARVEQVIGTAPANLDTLEEIANRLSDDADVVAALTTTVASKASNTLEINGYPLNADITLSAADVGAATTAQGAKADTAVQPAALSSFAPASGQFLVNAQLVSAPGNVTLPATHAAHDVAAGSHNITFVFGSPSAGHAFILHVVGTGTRQWPAEVVWQGDAPTAVEEQWYQFMTLDGGVSWRGAEA